MATKTKTTKKTESIEKPSVEKKPKAEKKAAVKKTPAKAAKDTSTAVASAKPAAAQVSDVVATEQQSGLPQVETPEGTVEMTPVEGDADAAAPKKAKKERHRSSRYTAVRAQVDRTKKYDPFAGIELLKKLSYTKFPGTVTAHVVVREEGLSVPLTLPHSTGKAVRVAIVDDAVLKEIESGALNFDILIAAPEYMPKLARFAPTLGPKGLMPNPKNGTLTKDTAGAKKKLEGGTVTIRTEKKAPLMHIRIGTTTMETKALVENVETLVRALNMKALSLVLAATMSPGVKIDIASIQTA